jgi:hypothetical protein
MKRTHEYRDFNIDVAVEADFSWNAGAGAKEGVKFVAVVRIRQVGAAPAIFFSGSFRRIGE